LKHSFPTRRSSDLECSIEVKRYLTRPNGINYSNEPVWHHPWSPHYAVSNIGFAPRHPQPGGFSYRHWPALVTGSGNHASAPAKVISHFAENRQLKKYEQLRVWTFGYDMKNNKARCWYETTLPLILLPETMRLDFAKRVEQLTNAAAEVAGYLKSCVKEAWFSRPSDVRGDDAGFLAVGVAASFYERTEQGFYELLKRLRDTLQVSQDDQPLLHQWHGVLRKAAFDVFDLHAAPEDMENANPRRIAKARDKLKKQLYSRRMKELLMLPSKPKEKAA
jgi:CRISPR system Cascade subunit CasA